MGRAPRHLHRLAGGSLDPPACQLDRGRAFEDLVALVEVEVDVGVRLPAVGLHQALEAHVATDAVERAHPGAGARICVHAPGFALGADLNQRRLRP